MKVSPFDFTIGHGQWAEQIRYFTTELDPNYWKNFRPCTVDEILTIERETQRTLPEDFKEFLRIFGHGSFVWPFLGGIYDPDEIISVCHAHLWTFLQSGDWASGEEQQKFYVSRGVFNPNPEKFTPDVLTTEYGNLFDLMQIGTDGLCGYHLLGVASPPASFGYGLLDVQGGVNDMAGSFSDGLRHILNHHWMGENEE